MPGPKPSKPRKAYPLRLPPDLYARLAKIAQEEHRTINAQLVHALAQWLESRPGR
jgi:hypothetical protein